MKLSMKTDYAVRVLFTLVEHYGEGPIPIRELARRNNVPKRFLEHIMLDLKEQGWVGSQAGNRGGYVLARNPEKITLGEVVRHFDGVLAPIGCVSITHYERCDQEPVCRFRRMLLEIRNYTARIMDRETLATAFRGRPVSRREFLGEGLFDRGTAGGESGKARAKQSSNTARGKGGVEGARRPGEMKRGG